MPPRSRATGLDRLAPDQRAAVELVLRQGRSYPELADLLGMPEETIRARARGGLVALAPDLPAPSRAGEIADWLLGQQSDAHAARTREHLLADPAAQRWAATVAATLREVPGGESVPALPTGTEPAEPRVNGAHPPAGTQEVAAAAPPAAPIEPGPRPAAEPDPPEPSRGGSSRLGGAILIGAAVALVALVLVFVFTRGGEDPETAADTPTATATATAAAGRDIALLGPAGSQAVGLMRLFEANDGTIRFAIAAQGVAPNKTGETYSVWFRKADGSDPLLVGDVKTPVGERGELTSAGPGNEDVDKFPEWLTTYETIIVTRDDEGAKEPGTVILKGDLPAAAQTGG